jgi:hypothetical protein
MALGSLAPLRVRRSRLERLRATLDDGATTTLHLASYHLSAFRPRVALLERPAPLVHWCSEQQVSDAVVGGFFVRPDAQPLGELRIDGEAVESVPFDAPWSRLRACVQISDEGVRIARRSDLGGEPPGDVLQAGPLLVANGRPAFFEGEDVEGFSAGSAQFDSDITRGRYPRTALALIGNLLVAAVCDGRGPTEAGMTLAELTDTLVQLGASDALNLDGGGSASLVYDGRLRNRPREEHGLDLLDGRPVVSAIVFDAR